MVTMIALRVHEAHAGEAGKNGCSDPFDYFVRDGKQKRTIYGVAQLWYSVLQQGMYIVTKCGFWQGSILCFEEDCQESVVQRELLDKKLWSNPECIRDKVAFEENINKSPRE